MKTSKVSKIRENPTELLSKSIVRLTCLIYFHLPNKSNTKHKNGQG